MARGEFLRTVLKQHVLCFCAFATVSFFVRSSTIRLFTVSKTGSQLIGELRAADNGKTCSDCTCIKINYCAVAFGNIT